MWNLSRKTWRDHLEYLSVGGREGIILKCILIRRLYALIASSDCRESDIETSFSVQNEGFFY